MRLPLTVLCSVISLGFTQVSAQQRAAPDSLRTYQAALATAIHRVRNETTQDVATRIERVMAPVPYDSLQHALVADAKRWARAEARYYRFIGAEPTTCLSGPQGSGCADPERRLSPEGKALAFEVRVAREAFTKTLLGLRQHLTADLGGGADGQAS